MGRSGLVSFLLFISWSVLSAQDECVVADTLDLTVVQNECSPDFLRASATVNLNGSTASSSTTPLPGCGGYSGGKNDLWYTLVVPSGETELEFITGSISPICIPLLCTNTPAIEVYRGNNCTDLASIQCFESFAGFPPIIPSIAGFSESVSGLNPGERLWIRVWDSGDETYEVRLTVKTPSELPNDNCSNPLPLSDFGCNIGAGGNDFQAISACGWNSTENSVFYEFTVTSSTPQPVSFTIENITCTGGGGDIQFAIFDMVSDCEGLNGSSDSRYHGCASGNGDVTITANKTLPPGQYLFAVDGLSGAECKWGVKGDVVVKGPEADFGLSDTVICPGSCIMFTDSSKNLKGPTTWSWNFGDASTGTGQNPEHCYASPGVYDVTLTVIDNGDTAIAVKQIRVKQNDCPMTINCTISKDTICPGQCVDVQVVVLGGNGALTYSWSNGLPASAGPHVVCPNKYERYAVTVTDGSGQTDTCSVDVHIRESFVINSDVTFSKCDGDSTLANIDISLTGTVEPVFYVWKDGPTSEDRTDLLPKSYTLTVLDGSGCGPQDTTIVIDTANCMVVDTTKLELPVIPNVITPNNDGFNDVFEVLGLPDNTTLTIYNRWGKLIRTIPNYSNDWDGTTEGGKTVSEGVYYYILSAPEASYKGFLTVLHLE